MSLKINPADGTIKTEGGGGITLTPSASTNVTINEAIYLPDGTASKPAVLFTDDTNTGMYSPANDTIAFATNGVETLLITGVASSVNYLEFKPSITTSPLLINALGTDTNIDINIVPKGTGNVKLGTMKFDADQTIGAGQDNYVLTYDNATGTIGLEAAGGGATGYHYSGTITTAPAGTGEDTIVIGDGADGKTATDSVLIGKGVWTDTAESDVIVGPGCYNDSPGLAGYGNVIIGRNTRMDITTAAVRNVIIGDNNQVNAGNSIVIGYSNDVSGGNGNSIVLAVGASGTFAQTAALHIGTSNTHPSTSNTITLGSSNGSNSSLRGVKIGHYHSSLTGTQATAIGSSLGACSGNYTTTLGVGSLDNGKDACFTFSPYYTGPESFGEINFSTGGFNYVATGTAKIMFVPLWVQTTDATVTEMGVGKGAGETSPTNRIALTDNSTYLFNVDIVARRTDADNENAMYNLTFGIKRDSGAASVALVGAVSKTVIAEDTAAWDVTVTADTTNGRPKFEVTGEASKTIRWVANARITKVGE